MSDHDMRAAAREWRTGLIVVVAGFAVAIAVAGYFAYASRNPAPVPQASIAVPTLTPAQREEQLKRLALALCAVEIVNAKNIGIVPPYGRYAGGPKATDHRGRYVCVASTGVAKYSIAADLVCRQLLDARCVDIYSVTSDDGTVLYKRPKG
jgi:hypothetical protein